MHSYRIVYAGFIGFSAGFGYVVGMIAHSGLLFTAVMAGLGALTAAYFGRDIDA